MTRPQDISPLRMERPPDTRLFGKRASHVTAALAGAAAVLVLVALAEQGKWIEARVGGESMMQLHAASAHFPIGLLIASGTFDLAALLFRRSDLRIAAFWTLLMGTAGAVATATIGLLGNPYAGEASGMAVKALVHRNVGLGAAGFFCLLAVWRMARHGCFSRTESILFGAATLTAVALVAVTGYLGGHLMEG